MLAKKTNEDAEMIDVEVYIPKRAEDVFHTIHYDEKLY
jgi:hypothetical protein